LGSTTSCLLCIGAGAAIGSIQGDCEGRDKCVTGQQKGDQFMVRERERERERESERRKAGPTGNDRTDVIG
jgi:hypothetical protein